MSAIALLGASWLSSWVRAGWPMDEGQLLAYPDFVLRGAVPNLDFEHTYGPMNLWVLAAAYRALGTSIVVERAMGLVYRAAAAASVAAILRAGGATRWSCTFAVWLALAFASPTELAAFAWFGGLACAAGSVAVVTRVRDNGRMIVSGALGGLAVSFRPDLIPAVVMSAAPHVTASRRSFVAWTAGMLAGTAPLAWHVGRIGGAAALRSWLFHPLLSAPGRRLPIPPRNVVDLLAFVVVLGATLLLVRAALRRRKRADAAVALLAVGLLPQMFQRADLAHVAFVGCTTLPLAIAEYTRLATRPAPWQKAAAGLVVVMATAALVKGVVAHFARPRAAIVELGERSFPLDQAENAAALNFLLAELDQRAVAGERVFVGPRDLRRTHYADTFVYALLPRLSPGSYHTELNPGVANGPDSRLARDLSTADWLLLTDRHEGGSEPNSSREPGDAAASRVVAASYCPVAMAQHYMLLERRDRHAPGVARARLPAPLSE